MNLEQPAYFVRLEKRASMCEFPLLEDVYKIVQETFLEGLEIIRCDDVYNHTVCLMAATYPGRPIPRTPLEKVEVLKPVFQGQKTGFSG